MTYSPAEHAADRALALTGGDWAAATHHLCLLAEREPALLLELTRPYLRGAAAKAVHQAARRQDSTPARKLPPVPATPVDLGQRQTVKDGNVWDAIIAQMQGNPALDAEQHEKALRVIAKAFAARRLESREFRR